MRDGVNLSRIQVTRPLVMHTEVTNLPNLSFYLRFGRDLPVVRFADKYNDVPSIVEAFAERRSDARRVGKECVRPCSSRWSPSPYTHNHTHPHTPSPTPPPPPTPHPPHPPPPPP